MRVWHANVFNKLNESLNKLLFIYPIVIIYGFNNLMGSMLLFSAIVYKRQWTYIGNLLRHSRTNIFEFPIECIHSNHSKLGSFKNNLTDGQPIKRVIFEIMFFRWKNGWSWRIILAVIRHTANSFSKDVN